MMYDASKLCKIEKYASGDHYVVDPGVYVPKTIARIGEVLMGEAPVELIPVDAEYKGNPWFYPGIKEMLDGAYAVEPEAWKLALQAPDGIKPEDRKARELALAFVERYFKRALTAQVGGKIKLHIIKNDTYRIGR